MHKTIGEYRVDRRLDQTIRCRWTHSTFVIIFECTDYRSISHGVVSLNSGRVRWRFSVHCLHSVLLLHAVRLLPRAFWNMSYTTEMPRRNWQKWVPSSSSQLSFIHSGDWWWRSLFQQDLETSGPQGLITPQQDLENGVALLLIPRFIICITHSQMSAREL